MNEATQPRATRSLKLIQFLLGIGVHLFFAVPYLRRAHGVERMRVPQRYLLAVNHVSLLDTILIGAVCWRAGHCPILVLGDRGVWQDSWFRNFLSSRLGFLMERGKINPDRIRALQTFGRAGKEFNLVVFPEGTRGDGIHVAPCQPGIYFIAQEARLPLVPVFIETMQLVSTKKGRVYLLRGLRKIEVHFGEPIAPEKYLALSREEFCEFVRQQIAATGTPASGGLK